MQFKSIIAMVALLALGLPAASGITMVAGNIFDDNAFADTVTSSSGSYTVVSSAGISTLNASAAALSADVTESSLNTYAYTTSTGAALAGANIQFGFTDNYLVNGAGNDLAIFTIGAASFSVTLGGVTENYTSAKTYLTTSIGGTAYQVYVAKIDLSTGFNATAGQQFSSILIGMGIAPNLPHLAVVAAMNSATNSGSVNPTSVPDAGSTISMLGAAAASLGLLRRKLQ